MRAFAKETGVSVADVQPGPQPVPAFRRRVHGGQRRERMIRANWFAFEHVKSGGPGPSTAERIDQIGFPDHRTAGGVHEDSRGLHHRELGCPEQAAGLLGVEHPQTGEPALVSASSAGTRLRL